MTATLAAGRPWRAGYAAIGSAMLVLTLLFAATLTDLHLGSAIALLFIASMLTIAGGFAVFLFETRLGARQVRVRSELLQHRVDDPS